MALRVDNKREQIPASSQLDTIKDRQLGSKFQTNTLGGCAGFLDQPGKYFKICKKTAVKLKPLLRVTMLNV